MTVCVALEYLGQQLAFGQLVSEEWCGFGLFFQGGQSQPIGKLIRRCSLRGPKRFMHEGIIESSLTRSHPTTKWQKTQKIRQKSAQ
jgi:hypothetical protein